MTADERAEPLTQAEMDAIAERAAKATPGPWYVWEPSRSDTEDMPSVCMGEEGPMWHAPHYDYLPNAPISGRRQAAMPDAAFIAAARLNIPRLLATLEALRPLVVALAAIDVSACPFADCNRPYDFQHAADCPVTRARAVKARLGW